MGDVGPVGFVQRARAAAKRSGRTGKVNWEQDTLYSEDFGFSVATASVTDITVYVVPSGKTFHIKTLKIHASAVATTEVRLFASVAAANPIDRYWVLSTSDTIVGAGANPGDLQGLKFSSTQNVYAQIIGASTGVTIYVGGQLRDSDA
jgi:hypothetical protein